MPKQCALEVCEIFVVWVVNKAIKEVNCKIRVDDDTIADRADSDTPAACPSEERIFDSATVLITEVSEKLVWTGAKKRGMNKDRTHGPPTIASPDGS
jgi:hypothetical protein